MTKKQPEPTDPGQMLRLAHSLRFDARLAYLDDRNKRALDLNKRAAKLERAAAIKMDATT